MAYATAIAMPDLNHVCDLHPSSRQHQILSPLREARDQTCNLMVPSQFRFHCATMGTLTFLICQLKLPPFFDFCRHETMLWPSLPTWPWMHYPTSLSLRFLLGNGDQLSRVFGGLVLVCVKHWPLTPSPFGC